MALPDFKSKACERYFALWQRLRPADGIPALSDLFDAADPNLQPQMAILDLVAPTVLRVRLFATRLVDYAGVDLTGTNLHSFARSEQFSAQVNVAATVVTSHTCGLLSRKVAATAAGRRVTIEMMSLPLRPFAGGPPAIGAAVEVLEQLDFQERVFGLERYEAAEWVDVGYGVPAAAIQIPA